MATASGNSPPSSDPDDWPVFALPWDDNTTGATDMSFLLDKPAGAQGFIRVRDGHLATDTERWRAWGVNITFGNPLPSRDDAPIIARRLAKFGINCIRLHHMDRRWPNGIIARRIGPDPDPALLDRDTEPDALRSTRRRWNGWIISSTAAKSRASIPI